MNFTYLEPAIPEYQKSAVETYFSKHNPPYKYYSELVNDTSEINNLGAHGGVYNRIGRGIPDVSNTTNPIPIIAYMLTQDPLI